MNDLIEITWSAGSIDEARKVCRFLVQERWVACAQIIPWVESIYLWDQSLETAQESKVVLKGKKEHLDQICKTIKANTHYELPEILWRSLEGGFDPYLKWIHDSSNKS